MEFADSGPYTGSCGTAQQHDGIASEDTQADGHGQKIGGKLKSH
ncbi:hypothetical protein [Streptomyces spirodelae]|nr:hypothetical protein [Streptomyces spirodelae]